MGTDYYETSEMVVRPDGSTKRSNILGYYGLALQYYHRYRLPVMHTETNQFQPLNAAYWLERQWANVLRLRQEGYPVIGFTWYSLTDQVDWDTDLIDQHGNVNSCGLYDLDRRIRRVGVTYQRIVRDWRHALADVDFRY
jgi:beta-glucosidase/6-phospho-beta-glucosidase/beta-galactosidase